MVRHRAGAVRTIDAGRVTGPSGETKWFAGVLGAGFDAIVNARCGGWRWPSGQMRYNLAVLRELPVFRPIPYVVELDGRRIETSAMLVAVANTPSFGGGMRVCPDADPADGLFDVLVVKAISVPAFLRVFPKVYRGAHVTHEAVEIHRARQVRLEASTSRHRLTASPSPGLPLDMEMVPQARCGCSFRRRMNSDDVARRGEPQRPALREFAAELDFPMDDFQVEACRAVENGRGVLVAAPTGAGKTVVGEFAVHLALKTGRKAFYTTPIKALSNQKYADLVRRHGVERVGLLTGDASINGRPPWSS